MSRPVHFEILADDPKKVGEFYAQALGWEVSSYGEGEPTYWLITTGPKEAPGIDGGLMAREFAQAVINTIAVDSLEATLDKVRAAGGKVVSEPHEIQGVGRHAYCADPEGNLFGVLQPAMESG